MKQIVATYTFNYTPKFRYLKDASHLTNLAMDSFVSFIENMEMWIAF